MKFNTIIAILLLSILLLAALTFSVLPQEIEPERRDSGIIFLYKVERVPENTFKTRLEINSSISENDIDEYILFYNQFTRNTLISREIIRNSLQQNVPIHISFSIAWAESRFTHTAVSRVNGNGTRDWGLFQLNDSYRNWSRDQFFNIQLNSREGISYYKWCLDQLEDVILALKAYNAGITRVLSRSAIPPTTYRYVDQVLEFESLLDKQWNDSFGGNI